MQHEAHSSGGCWWYLVTTTPHSSFNAVWVKSANVNVNTVIFREYVNGLYFISLLTSTINLLNYVSFICHFRRLTDRLDAAKPKTHLNKRIDWNESPRTRKPVSPTLLSVVFCVLLFRAMSEISIVPRLHSSTSTLYSTVQYSCSICSKCGVKELSAS